MAIILALCFLFAFFCFFWFLITLKIAVRHGASLRPKTMAYIRVMMLLEIAHMAALMALWYWSEHLDIRPCHLLSAALFDFHDFLLSDRACNPVWDISDYPMFSVSFLRHFFHLHLYIPVSPSSLWFTILWCHYRADPRGSCLSCCHVLMPWQSAHAVTMHQPVSKTDI